MPAAPRVGALSNLRALRLSLLCALFALAPLAASQEDRGSAPPRLGARLKAIDQPAVLGVAEAPAEIRVGRATIRPTPGRPLLVLSVDGRPCGVALPDGGELAYRVEDRFSIPVARRNQKRARVLALREEGGALLLSTAIGPSAVWGWDLGIAATGPAPAGAALPAELAELLAKDLDSNPGRDLTLAESNGEAGFRWALFRTDGDPLTLDVDPRPWARQETLSRLDRLDSDAGPFAGRWFSEEVAAQPIGGVWWDAPAVDYLALETHLDVKQDSAEHVVVTARTRVETMRDGVSVLPFTLVDVILDDHGRPRPYTLKRLTVDGREADHAHRDNVLLVDVGRELKRGESVTVETSSEGELLIRPGGNSYWMLGIWSWYPKLAGAGEEFAAFEISAESLDPFVPFASGEIKSREKTATGTRVRTWLRGPMQHAVVLAGKYRTVTDEADGSRIHVSAYVDAKDSEAKRVAGIVRGIRGCFEQWLGVPYPFQDLQVLEIADWGWGQAPPGVIFITQEAFMTPARAQLDTGDREIAAAMSRGINERIAHEVAHHWFPHVAKVVRSEENWLSESLADYTSALCQQRTAPDQRQARYFFERRRAEWKLWTREAGDDASVYVASHLAGGERDFRTWHRLLYGKGPWVLHALHRELQRQAGDDKKGDDLFFSWIRSYVKTFTYKPGGTRHLVGILDQITGRSWQPWFERYVYGTETPKGD